LSAEGLPALQQQIIQRRPRSGEGQPLHVGLGLRFKPRTSRGQPNAVKPLRLAGGILGARVFITKVMVFMLMYIWFRATFPRFRFDQLMDLGWKWMIPLALANIAVTAIVVLLGQELNFQGEVVLSIAGAAIIAFTLFLLLRPRAKVTHARRVSEA